MPRHLHLLLLLALFFCFNPTAQTQSCTPPPAGIVGWWPGDGNADDIIGGNNGTDIGGVAFAPGVVGQAFSFDGLSAYVNVPANASFHPAAITVELWLKANDLSDNPSIVSSNITNDYNGYQLQIQPDGTVGFVIGGNTIRTYYTSTVGDIVPGQWYHVAVTYDGVGGVGSLKLYLNGMQETFSLNQSANFMEPSGPIYYSGDCPLNIGRRVGNADLLFNGFVDEVSIYNRALSASEIQAIYNAGSAGTCKSLPALSVSARMDIYRAGGYNDLSDGVGPAVYTIQAGTVPTITFSGITGTWGCAPSAPPYGPDGTTGPGCVARSGGLNINPIGPFSGYASTDFGGALTGVFLSDSLSTSAPPSLRFYLNDSSKGGIQTNFTSLSPAIGQVFFVGDGLTGTGAGSPQVFQVPPTATHLYLGYLDSCNGTSPAPSCFNTNTGSVFPTVSASCAFSISPTSQSFGATGGFGEVTVTTLLPPLSCGFLPTASANWIVLGHKCPGGGSCPYYPPAFTYSVDANTGQSQRTGTLTVAGQTVTVTQSGAGACTYSITPTGQTFSENGGHGTVTVTAQSGCSWSAVSNVSWVMIATGSSGSGNGSVTFNITANSGPPRTGTLTIAGQTYGVTQSASGCGATDVSNKINVQRNAFLPFGIPPEVFTQTISLTNASSQPISGPIYLVMDGLPRTGFPCNLNGVTACNVTPAPAITFCQSPAGSDLVLFSPGAMTPGQTVSGTLTFVPGPFGGGENSGFNYSTRVFSGTPSQ